MSSLPVRHGNTIIFPASLDPKAVSVVKRLTEAGFESYLVGGCVRDLLLGRIPKDFDASTEARPRQIRRVFRNCRIIGRRFKLAHVHFGEQIIEVATFRRNPAEAGDTGEVGEDDDEPGDESSGQDADDLLITRDNVYGSAEEDIRRRDFTMNALLYDVASDEVIDYVGGFEDLERRVLRTIGDPMTRLAEDPVRMLRAVKFTSRLDLQLDQDLDQALRASADLISRSAPPRVLEEIYKLLTCGRAERSLDMLAEYGLLQRLVPEIAGYWAGRRAELTALGRALDIVDAGHRRVGNAFLLAALFHDPWKAALATEETDALAAIRDLLAPAALRMNIPRRDVAIVKQLLTIQLRLERPRRSRRFRMSDFLGRTSTREGIDLLHVRALAGGADPELHATWAERLAWLGGPQPARETLAREELGGDRPRTGRRRRRRSRGRRSGGAEADPRPDRAEAPVTAGQAALVHEGPATTTAGAVRDSTGAPPAPAGPMAAEAGGLKGLVRSWVQRFLGTPEPEHPVGREVPAPTPAPAAPPEVEPAIAEAFPIAEQGSTAPSPAGTGPEGERPSRRRRRRRGRGVKRGGEATVAPTETAGAVQQNGAAPASETPPRSKRRRSRRSRRRGAERQPAAQRERPPGEGSPRPERPPRTRRRSRDGASRSDRTERSPSPSSTSAPPTPQHRPEDIEDVFDW